MRRPTLRHLPLAALLAVSIPGPASAVPDPQSGGAIATAQAPVVQEAAPAAPAPKPVAVVTLNADVNLTTQQMTVSSGGKTLHVWAISSGTRDHATPTGTFKPGWMAKMWFSKQYDDAPMPHAVFFNGGIATHATQATGRLGSPASHGCVRLAPANAATFYGLVQKHGLSSTRIVVRGAPKFREEVAAKRNRSTDEPSRQIVRVERPAQNGSYAYARPIQPYGYGQSYGYVQTYRPTAGYYAQVPRVYEQRWPGDGPPAGQMRYVPRGYVRY